MLETIAQKPIGSLEHREPVRVKSDMPLLKVAYAMKEQRRGAVLVKDESGQLLGIFTERDLMTVAATDDLNWHQRPVADAMTQNPVTVSTSDPLSKAIRLMKRGGFRHLPMIDNDGGCCGILSVRDIFAYIADCFPEEFVNLPPDPQHEASTRWGG